MTKLALLLAAAAAVAALTMSVSAAGAFAAQRRCTNECIFVKGNDGVQPGWFEAEWATNANIWYLRGVAKCGNGTRSTIIKLGGWVKSIDLFSKATCTSSYPNLVGAAHDVKHCSTCSFTRTWDTIPVKQ